MAGANAEILQVPHLRQQRDWSCGPACVRMVLRYFGEDVSESDLIEALSASDRDGTSPERIMQHLRARGLAVRQRRKADIRWLQLQASARTPVLVACQDWAHKPGRTDYAHSWDNGHYAVVVAASPETVTLCDPSSKRPRRHIPAADFLARWRDISSDGKLYKQWGCVVGPKKGRA